MIPYYGRNSLSNSYEGSQYASDTKHVHCAAVMAIRTGRDTSTDRQPLGLSVLNTMADIVFLHSQAEYHQLFFDNFFTSLSLIQSLSEKGIRCVGTIRDNRTGGASKTLLSKSGMKKKERGSLTTAVTVIRSSC